MGDTLCRPIRERSYIPLDLIGHRDELNQQRGPVAYHIP